MEIKHKYMISLNMYAINYGCNLLCFIVRLLLYNQMEPKHVWNMPGLVQTWFLESQLKNNISWI